MLQEKTNFVQLVSKPEFKNLLPELSYYQKSQLEKDIQEKGCLSPITVQKDTNVILDGHNRYDICKKNNIKFETVSLEFNSNTDMIIWMIKNQLNRRDLSKYEKIVLTIKMNDFIQQEALLKRDSTLKQNLISDNQISDRRVKREELNTNKRLSKIAGVSHDTIAKVKKIESNIDDETRELLRTEKRSIHEVFQEVKSIEQRKKNEELKKEKLLKELPNIIESQELFEVIYINNNKKKPIKLPAKDKCVLFIWTRPLKLEVTMNQIKKWGFKYTTCMVFESESKHSNFELLLIAVKNGFEKDEFMNKLDFIVSEKIGTKLSSDYFNIMIEKLFPTDHYLEISENEKCNEKWVTMINVTN